MDAPPGPIILRGRVVLFAFVLKIHFAHAIKGDWSTMENARPRRGWMAPYPGGRVSPSRPEDLSGREGWPSPQDGEGEEARSPHNLSDDGRSIRPKGSRSKALTH